MPSLAVPPTAFRPLTLTFYLWPLQQQIVNHFRSTVDQAVKVNKVSTLNAALCHTVALNGDIGWRMTELRFSAVVMALHTLEACDVIHQFVMAIAALEIVSIELVDIMSSTITLLRCLHTEIVRYDESHGSWSIKHDHGSCPSKRYCTLCLEKTSPFLLLR